ncbi:hypothetical protein BKA56DRAFT_588222 [Ilyonectria sp. MPI-CAGE-AT-0026]|nr:hypothetical protein BKA56DRAFT_588222 [Ilyonectria sp. MPI-CAGE-AT-0026]
MPLKSKNALRIHGMPGCTTKQTYEEVVEILCAPPSTLTKRASSLFRLSDIGQTRSSTDGTTPLITALEGEASPQLMPRPPPTPSDEPASTSFVFQHKDAPVGTISFSDRKRLKAALNVFEKAKKNKDPHWSGWEITNEFRGITVLHEYPAADKVEMDICAVHGLGGNAIDSWTADNGKMWLKDYLPSSQHFTKSRIMTFGYDADLADQRSLMTLENWAENLLQMLMEVRTSKKQRRRPLLFVCHSFGGLVVRKAMIKLSTTKHKGLSLAQCGLIFLATPHTGTSIADWNALFVATAGLVGGVRSEIVDRLRAFNSSSLWDKSAFLNLNPLPPFQCYAEGMSVQKSGIQRIIVTQDSASLDSQTPAHMIMRADHCTISKFSTNSMEFITVVNGMSQVYAEISTTYRHSPVVRYLISLSRPKSGSGRDSSSTDTNTGSG